MHKFLSCCQFLSPFPPHNPKPPFFPFFFFFYRSAAMPRTQSFLTVTPILKPTCKTSKRRNFSLHGTDPPLHCNKMVQFLREAVPLKKATEQGRRRRLCKNCASSYNIPISMFRISSASVSYSQPSHKDRLTVCAEEGARESKKGEGG